MQNAKHIVISVTNSEFSMHVYQMSSRGPSDQRPFIYYIEIVGIRWQNDKYDTLNNNRSAQNTMCDRQNHKQNRGFMVIMKKWYQWNKIALSNIYFPH